VLLQDAGERRVRALRRRGPLLGAEAQPVRRGAELDRRAEEIAVRRGRRRLGPAKLDPAHLQRGPDPHPDAADQRREDIVHVHRRHGATVCRRQREAMLLVALADAEGDGFGDQPEEAREAANAVTDRGGSGDEIVDHSVGAEREGGRRSELEGRVGAPLA